MLQIFRCSEAQLILLPNAKCLYSEFLPPLKFLHSWGQRTPNRQNYHIFEKGVLSSLPYILGKIYICFFYLFIKSRLNCPNANSSLRISLNFSRDMANILLHFLDQVLGLAQFQDLQESLNKILSRQENLYFFGLSEDKKS